MRRFLLTALAVVATTATFAQQVDLGQCETMSAWEHSVLVDEPVSAELYDPDAWKTQRRSYKNNFYYLKPAGTFYQAHDDHGAGYVQAILTAPPFEDLTYVNMAPDPTTCKWYLNGIDYTWRADAEGNYVQSLTPRANTGVYVPELRDADETQNYVMASQNYNLLNPVMTARQECEWLALCDHGIATVAEGFLDTNYLGTGTYTDTYGTYGPAGAVYTSKGIVQDFPAPASPLYVEDVYIPVLSPLGERAPLKDGATLTLNIRDQATGELLEAITATNDDYIYWSYVFDDERGALKFTKTEDNLFGVERVPFVIDRAVTFEIFGVDEPGVMLGFSMLHQFDCDADLAPGYLVLENQETGDTINVSFTGSGYGMPRVWQFVFLSLFDKVAVAESLTWDDASTGEPVATVSGYNELQITRDGRECHTYGLEDTPYDLGALYVTTACAWYDDEKNENYSFAEELPSWITGWEIDDSYYDPENSEYPSSVHYLTFTAEPLPEGVESREASLHLQGRGYTDATLVTIIQTDAESTGIERVETGMEASASGATYSVSGQRVTDSAKGILVRDGRKFINR